MEEVKDLDFIGITKQELDQYCRETTEMQIAERFAGKNVKCYV